MQKVQERAQKLRKNGTFCHTFFAIKTHSQVFSYFAIFSNFLAHFPVLSQALASFSKLFLNCLHILYYQLVIYFGQI